MTVKIGILGAADIAPVAVTEPAQTVDGVEVTVVAARDPKRAQEFATKHDIPKVAQTYEEVLTDPTVDVVYVPTPASLHGKWTKKAVEAGKIVLCEKPFTANAAEAREVAEAAQDANVLVMEAMHSVYHPMWQEAKRVIASGELGDLQSIEAVFNWPIPDKSDIRWNPELAGGAVMDLGIYPITLLMDLFGPLTVVDAEAEDEDGVDAWLTGNLRTEAGVPIRFETSMDPDVEMSQVLRVEGDEGDLVFDGYVHPHNVGSLEVTVDGKTRTVEKDERSSYSYMVEVLRDAIEGGTGVETDADRAVEVMGLVDELYLAAGLPLRQPSA